MGCGPARTLWEQHVRVAGVVVVGVVGDHPFEAPAPYPHSPMPFFVKVEAPSPPNSTIFSLPTFFF